MAVTAYTVESPGYPPRYRKVIRMSSTHSSDFREPNKPSSMQTDPDIITVDLFKQHLQEMFAFTPQYVQSELLSCLTLATICLDYDSSID